MGHLTGFNRVQHAGDSVQQEQGNGRVGKSRTLCRSQVACPTCHVRSGLSTSLHTRRRITASATLMPSAERKRSVRQKVAPFSGSPLAGVNRRTTYDTDHLTQIT
jgi:hypothetical protein